MSDIKLSICIPVYNGEKYIGYNLDVMISQINMHGLHDKVEIIVSDNNSTDKTADVVHKKMTNCNIIKYYRNEKNLGYYNNMIKLLSYANGEYIHFMGDDDFYAEGSLIRILDKLNENYGVLLLGNYFYRNFTKQFVKRREVNPESFENDLIIRDANIFKLYILDRDWPVTNLVFNRKKLLDVKIPDELNDNDWIHIYWLLDVSIHSEKNFFFSDDKPIVCNRVDVQTWLNRKRGAKIYYNNILVSSYSTKLGYDPIVFNSYKIWFIKNRLQNIKYTSPDNIKDKILFIIKYSKILGVHNYSICFYICMMLPIMKRFFYFSPNHIWIKILGMKMSFKIHENLTWPAVDEKQVSIFKRERRAYLRPHKHAFRAKIK